MSHYGKFIPGDGLVGAKILFVGEAPGEHEHNQGLPFVGPSGDILLNCLGRNGLSRSEVRLANLFPYRPYGNKFETILGTSELEDNIRNLIDYINRYRPNVIVPLGAWPLKFLTGRVGIRKWRGSIIPYLSDPNIKCIPTYHPAAVLRNHELYPIFDLDIKRIIGDADTPDFNLPQRKFIIDPRGLDVEDAIQRLAYADQIAVDIETIKRSTTILCVGFSPSPDLAIVFPAYNRQAIQRVLESAVKKIFQFGTFDITQLKLNGYQINNSSKRVYYWDTLVAQHVLSPELPRSLEFLSSIYTREPYYKTVGRGTIPDDEKGWSDKIEKQSLYEYNARDCCCTYEVAMAQQKEMAAAPKQTQAIFAHEMELLEVAHHMGDSGLPIDHERRLLIERELFVKWEKKQAVLDYLCEQSANVRSPKLKEILYDQLKLPVRRNHDGGITVDEDAIVSLIAFCKDKAEVSIKPETKKQWEIKLVACKLILEIRGIRQLLSVYIITTKGKKGSRFSSDGRLRSTYKVAGTDTGRLAASAYVDGTGINSMTLPREVLEISELATTVTLTAAQLNDEPDEEEVDNGLLADNV